MRQTVFEETLDGITIDRIIRDFDYNMATRHMHDEYEIYYLVEGERFYFVGQHSYHIRKGGLVLVNKNEIHKTGMAGGSGSYHDRILIELEEEPFASFFASCQEFSLADFFNENCGVYNLDPRAQHHVESLLLGIQSEIHKKLPGYRMSTMMKLAQLLIFVVRYKNEHPTATAGTTTRKKYRKVDEVASYIIDNIDKSISLESLADQFFVNKCYLSRIFKEATGFTVNEYINLHRINEAKKLLLSGDQSISDIAKTVGYESTTYFEKVFKAYTESSPLRYRNSR